MVQPRPVPRVHCHRASPLARRKLPQSLSRGLLGTHGEPPPGALSAVVGRGAKGRRASPLPCTRPPLGTAEPGLGASRLQTRDGTFGREAAPFWAQRQGNAEFQPLCLGDRKPRPREVVQRTQGYTAANGLSEVQVQRSDAWFRDGSSETKAPGARRQKAPCRRLACGSGGTRSRKPVSSAESLWPLAGVGQEEGGCSGCSDRSPRLPAAPRALSSGLRASQPILQGLGLPCPPRPTACSLGWGYPHGHDGAPPQCSEYKDRGAGRQPIVVKLGHML